MASSRVLRALALLAWLLMAVSLPAASAMAGEAQAMPPAHDLAHMMMDHAAPSQAIAMTSQHAGQHADHCCGTSSHSACHCEALCGSVMLPAVPALLGQLRLSDAHVSMRSVDAPTPQLIPPLRPPAVLRAA